jgi:photosystem II stability/assembly factor-like uncharacterized protein
VPWQALASSADGSQLVAGVYGGLIYISTDHGSNWAPANVPSLHWGGVASSADGTRLAAAAFEGAIYFSTDSGQNWSQATAPNAQWQAIASSADGIKLVSVIYNSGSNETGGIYAAQIPPALSIASAGQGAVLITWPAPATGFVLQERQEPTGTTWSNVTVTALSTNGENQVVVSASAPKHFYRLVQH